jgi:hypothetical protein
MNREALSRRRFLKLVGATALTAPFVRALPSYAGPGNNADPIYLVLLFTANGCVRYRWGAQGAAPTGSTAVVTPGPLQFRETLSAFTSAGPMKADVSKWVTVLDGLNNAAAKGSHEAGMASLWTGLTSTGSQATGPSIDQAIAPLLASQLSINRPYSNIALYAMSNQDYPQRAVTTRMLYDANGNYVDPISDPAAALSTLFPGASGTMKVNNTPNIRAAVLNQVNSDLTAMQGKLCTEDRTQLQTLQALWNQANKQIANAAAAAASCMAPMLGAPPTSGDPLPYNIPAMSTLMAMSLACDLTRVGSLQLSHALSPVTHSWLGPTQTNTHHIYSHQGPYSLYALGPDLYNESSSNTMMYPQQLIDIETFYAQQVANFAYMLSQLTTVTGKNLLDQTVICWGSEIDMGAAHNHDDTPFVLIGGGGGKIKANQLVRFPLNLPGNTQTTNNRFHNDLLLTLAQVMGVNVGTTFGTASYCTSPIMEVLA